MSDNTNTTATDEFIFDLNDLPELPEFTPWPAGSYKCEGVSLSNEVVSFGAVGDVPCVVITVKLKAINEVKPANAATPALETTMTWNYSLTGDDAEKEKLSQGRIRNLLAPFSAAFGTTLSNEIYAKFPGTTFTLVTNVRVKKGDKLAGEEDKHYSGIKSIIVD
jgi:hypothetical protein